MHKLLFRAPGAVGALLPVAVLIMLISPAAGQSRPAEDDMLHITILYDNYAAVADVETDWGFAALIEYGAEKILFDAGTQGRILLANAAALAVDLSHIDTVVFSHEHGDHTGGQADFYAALADGVSPVTWVIPSFPEAIKQRAAAAGRVEECATFTEIVPGIFSTGEIRGPVNEQALVVQLPAGIVVITGCAHPGIDGIVERARDHFGSDVLHVIGGFHLGGVSDARVGRIIDAFRRLGVARVTPTHCTGDRAIELFREAYGEDYLPGGIGRVIEIGRGIEIGR